MPSVWSRHPRYAVFVAVVILSTFYLLSGSNSFSYDFDRYDHGVPVSAVGSRKGWIYDADLPGRLKRSDAIYDKFLQILIEKAKALNIGNGLNETTGGGPVVSTPNTRPFVISRSALLSPRGTG